MKPDSDLGKYQSYLDSFKLTDNQYIIGIYQKGRTIYNQQLRAINIFYCLHKLGIVSKNTKIGIIGGGIAGVTFAAAALRSKIKVALIEKGQVLIPNQNKSQRPIHPHIYDWPKPNSTNLEAGLPVLNWTAGTADEVRKEIIKGFKNVEKFYKDRRLVFNRFYQEYLNSTPNKITYDAESRDYKIFLSNNTEPVEIKSKKKTKKKDDDFGSIQCDIIIYAVGFGIEISEHKYDLSYWQSMPTNQEIPMFNNKNYLISGVGDGGLMDLLTCRIRDFSYKNLIKLIDSNPKRRELEERLLIVREDFLHLLEEERKGGKKVDRAFMHKAFSGLLNPHYAYIQDNLQLKEVDFILHGKVKYPHIFNLDRVSLLNGFLIFLLTKKFKYISGEGKFDKDKHVYHIEGNSKDLSAYAKFSRYGTDLNKLINNVPGLEKLIKDSDIEKKQNAIPYKGDIDRLWDGDEEIHSIFNEAFYEDIKSISGNSLQTFETFGWLLFSVLSKIKHGKDFRLTIHKVSEEDNGLLYYQQIIPYFGSKISKSHGGYGRSFKWNHGSVGYSIALERPLLIQRKVDELKYQEILQYLSLEDKLKDYQNSTKKSILSIPIIAPLGNKKFSNFVLYIDSEEVDFFMDGTVYEVLPEFLDGLIKALDCLINKKQIDVSEHPEISKAFDNINIGELEKIGSGSLFGDNDDKYQTFIKRIEKMKLKHFYLLT